MIRIMKMFAALSLFLMIDTSLRSASLTLIDAEPSGKRVLTVDPDPGKSYQEVTVEATRKTSVFISGNDLLNPANMKTMLVVDDNDIRPTSNGLVLATFDGEDIVHGRRGKVIINYHHPPLNKQQLVAVLYTLKPELFRLTDEEIGAQKKEIAENSAEANRRAKMDPVVGKWELLNGHGPVAKVNAGDITFGAKKGDAYPVTFDHTKDGGPSWNGVAAFKLLNGDPIIFAAYGTPKTIGLCVYEIDGGKLSGKWYPWSIDGDAKNSGTEELKGPESLDGDFTIVSAKAPNTGAAYSGTVTIKPLEIVGAGDSEKPYQVTWVFGATKVQGIGIRTDKYLIVSSGAGPDVHIAKFKFQNGGATFSGDWFKLGSSEMGGTAAMK